MAEKEFKTLDEQIAILRMRGLSIPDEAAAKDFLLKNNYYRVSGYSLTLRTHDVFSENATFQNIVDIYCFDQEMRHLLLLYLETIEVMVKSIFSYEFTKEYGGLGYLDAAHFTDPAKHAEIIHKAEMQRRSRLRHEAYLKHFEKRKEDIPLWAYVDLLTIADISFFYKISPKPIKLAVADAIGLHQKGDELLTRFMHHMTILRNLCAHGSRLYNRLFEQKPWLSKTERALLLVKKDGTRDNEHLYSYLIIMRRLLPSSEFTALKSQLVALSENYPFVRLRYYGFPEDWYTVL